MRRLAACVLIAAWVLGLAAPVLAEYGPLDDPEDPIVALMLYHMAGPDYGQRTVWHPAANLFQAAIVDLAFAMLGQRVEEEFHPTADQRAKLAEFLEQELLVEVIWHSDYRDRAIVRVAFSTDEPENDFMDFAVALRNQEWYLFAPVDLDDTDPWAVFAPLDRPAD